MRNYETGTVPKSWCAEEETADSRGRKMVHYEIVIVK